MNPKAIVFLIILFSLVLQVGSFWDDSLIVDEDPHVGAGYSYLAVQDYRLNPEHPPLAKILGAIPLVFMDLNDKLAFNDKSWTTDINGQWDFGRKLIYQSDNDAQKITRYVKFPVLLFFILSAILIFVWTKNLYGDRTALLATFLFSFSPTVMAHSRFVTTDVAALFGVLLASFFFIRFLENPSFKNILLAGITLGIALLTKFSVFLLLPFFTILLIVWLLIYRKNYLLPVTCYLSLVTIAFMAVVWPVYAAINYNNQPDKQKADTTHILASFGNRTAADSIIYLSDKPAIRHLAHYGSGLLMVTQRAAGGNTAYFLGEVSSKAWKHYFPVVYVLKEPLAWWILVITSLIGVITQIAKGAGQRANTLLFALSSWLKFHFVEFAILLWLAIYWYTSITSNLNIGVRHLLPVYPFTIILVSGQISRLLSQIQISKLKYQITSKAHWSSIGIWILTFGLLGWYLAENLRIYPYYLTYFNQITLLRPSWATEGQAGGHLYVVDSNLDWGQDLKRLSDWVKQNPDINSGKERFYLDYFGWADPVYYIDREKINWLHAGQFNSLEEFLKINPKGGYIAVSATFYMNSRQNPKTSYDWLDNVAPTVVIGNSIFIWHLTPRLNI